MDTSVVECVSMHVEPFLECWHLASCDDEMGTGGGAGKEIVRSMGWVFRWVAVLCQSSHSTTTYVPSIDALSSCILATKMSLAATASAVSFLSANKRAWSCAFFVSFRFVQDMG